MHNAEFVNVKASGICAFKCRFIILYQMSKTTYTTSYSKYTVFSWCRVKLLHITVYNSVSLTFLVPDPF